MKAENNNSSDSHSAVVLLLRCFPGQVAVELSPGPDQELDYGPDEGVEWNPPPEPPPVNGSNCRDVKNVLEHADAPGLEADATIVVVG